MAINPKKLEAFVNRGKKGAPPAFVSKMKGGGKPPHEEEPDEPEHEHDEEGADVEGNPDHDAMVAEAGQSYDDGTMDDETTSWAEDYDPETEGNPPASVADEATWEKAKAAAKKSYEEDDPAFWPVTMTVYQKMGGTLKSE